MNAIVLLASMGEHVLITSINTPVPVFPVMREKTVKRVSPFYSVRVLPYPLLCFKSLIASNCIKQDVLHLIKYLIICLCNNAEPC